MGHPPVSQSWECANSGAFALHRFINLREAVHFDSIATPTSARSSNGGSYSTAIVRAQNTSTLYLDCDECSATSPRTHHNLSYNDRSSVFARRE